MWPPSGLIVPPFVSYEILSAVSCTHERVAGPPGPDTPRATCPMKGTALHLPIKSTMADLLPHRCSYIPLSLPVHLSVSSDQWRRENDMRMMGGICNTYHAHSIPASLSQKFCTFYYCVWLFLFGFSNPLKVLHTPSILTFHIFTVVVIKRNVQITIL